MGDIWRVLIQLKIPGSVEAAVGSDASRKRLDNGVEIAKRDPSLTLESFVGFIYHS